MKEGSAPQYPPDISGNSKFRIFPILMTLGTVWIINLAFLTLAPDVPLNIEETEIVGFQQSYRPGCDLLRDAQTSDLKNWVISFAVRRKPRHRSG